MNLNLGDKVRDTITGFAGTLTAKSEYINGCVQFCVSPPVDKDGKLVEAAWIDWQRLEVTEATNASKPLRAVGGPQDAPSTQYRG